MYIGVGILVLIAATINDAKHTARPARAAAEEAPVKVTDEDKVSAEGRAQMRDNLKQAGYT